MWHPVSHSLETSVTDDGGQDTGNFDPGDSDNEEAFQDAFDGGKPLILQ